MKLCRNRRHSSRLATTPDFTNENDKILDAKYFSVYTGNLWRPLWMEPLAEVPDTRQGCHKMNPLKSIFSPHWIGNSISSISSEVALWYIFHDVGLIPNCERCEVISRFEMLWKIFWLLGRSLGVLINNKNKKNCVLKTELYSMKLIIPHCAGKHLIQLSWTSACMFWREYIF